MNFKYKGYYEKEFSDMIDLWKKLDDENDLPPEHTMHITLRKYVTDAMAKDNRSEEEITEALTYVDSWLDYKLTEYALDKL